MKRQHLSKTGKQCLVLLLVNILFFGGYLLCWWIDNGIHDLMGVGYSILYLLFLFPFYGFFYGNITYRKTKKIVYPNAVLFMSGCVIPIIGMVASLKLDIIVSAIVTILSLISGIITMLVKKANEKLRRKMDSQTSAENTDKPSEDTDKSTERSEEQTEEA